ncbi:hypothetical protein HK100_011980 [Physocladia obscura]|uniref:UDP-N-acetylglucosamine transferase subunit ALG13 n=1 Tax=Physocladia obscura TaxID=109957 RepID=A0AAD5XGL3_9FUNG|nr:hypothetical protein HK100_011980 [Physocladia obscura]
MKLVFYISGHGLGHATRAVVTVQRLAEHGHHVTVVAANTQLFVPLVALTPDVITIRELAPPAAALDPTVSQKDAVSVDVSKSLKDMAAFLVGWEDKVEEELTWLRSQNNIDCVLLDAPFIPAVAAKKLNIPTILISNFTFDAIFDGLRRLKPSVQSHLICEILFDLYSNVDYLLRLPGAIPIPAFDSRRDSKDSICMTGSIERAVFDAMTPQDPTNDIVTTNILQNILLRHQPINREQLPPTKATIKHALENPPHNATFLQQQQHQRIYNIPLVVRMAVTQRDIFRLGHGIPAEAKVVLITFGGHSVTSSTPSRTQSRSVSPHPPGDEETSSFSSSATTLHMPTITTRLNRLIPPPIHGDLSHLSSRTTPALVPPGWHALIAVPGPMGDLLNDYIDATPSDRVSIEPPGAYVPDMLRACDVVVGKCGYGTCAEVVAHEIPLVYVPRPVFVEEVGLVDNLMKPFGIGVEMSQKDFYAGNWTPHILKAFQLKAKGPALKIRTDGDKVVVACIESIVAARKSPS